MLAQQRAVERADIRDWSGGEAGGDSDDVPSAAGEEPPHVRQCHH